MIFTCRISLGSVKEMFSVPEEALGLATGLDHVFPSCEILTSQEGTMSFGLIVFLR
jgi:hypothetical protein